ncbi:MAG TPA: response regulator [Candidatus Latescibacteria bacterium]|nr:response regulator [Candidatus Latescibacterota bacterium]
MRRPKVLVVDDDPGMLDVLGQFLRENRYEVELAHDGLEALQKVREAPPDLILLDVVMPRMDGIEVCQTLKSQKSTRLIPIVIVTGLTDLEDKVRGIEAGADDILHKPFHFVELGARVRSLVKVKRLNERLEDVENVLFALANAVEAKDAYTEEHTERVSRYAVALGRKVGLDRDYTEALCVGGMLHDVGKIGIPDHILLKPGKLSDKEFEHIKAHPIIGERICRPLRSLTYVLPGIRYHHERVDGRGYPDGLRGEEIPIEARILAIADAFDAMTADRPYRRGMSPKEAIEELRRYAGKQWDRDLVEELMGMLERGELDIRSRRIK